MSNIQADIEARLVERSPEIEVLLARGRREATSFALSSITPGA